MYDRTNNALQTMVMGSPRRGWKPYSLLTAIIVLLIVGAVPAIMLGSQFIGPWASYRTRGLAVIQREFAAFPPCAPGLQPTATRTVSGPWVDLSIERDYTISGQCASPLDFYAANAVQAGWTERSSVAPSDSTANFDKSSDGYPMTLNVECDANGPGYFRCYVNVSTRTPTFTGSYNGDLAIFAVGALFFCLLAYAALTNRPLWGRL